MQQTVQDFATEHPASFDLVVICDVLHHLAWERHAEFLATSVRTLRPGGGLVLKDWEKTSSLVYLLAYLSDRYLTAMATGVVSGTPGFSAVFTSTVCAVCLAAVLNGY